jgi:hypothetical protein
VVVAVVCIAVLAAAVWRQLDAGPPIESKALGVWQEQTASRPARLTVSVATEQADATSYWVTYPRSFTGAFPARLDGDRIVVWGENAKDVVWVITYDEGADTLLATRPATGERHILRRVSR